jgi:phage shock protein PspC (stress-responsive transcriptional regulator)
MKKTFTINISGSIFHIDDDAFEKLQKYLHMLNKHFGPAMEGQEILQDIEARIAELFLEKTRNKVEVITDFMVDEVIARMGKPEDFMEQEEESSTKAQPEEASTPNESQVGRRLYRDGDNKVIGGVCSGLATYFKIDPVIVRVIFIVANGVSLLAYIILWIAIPEYKTTASTNESPSRRRLYRDGDRRVLGGICSGMAAYFNMDIAIIRVIFFLLFFVIGPFNLLLYFILWIVVPKAKTTAQRLEMRGKEATISNIEKSIKEEMSDVGESYNKFASAKNEKGVSRINSFGQVVGSVLRVVLRVIVLLFGAALIIGGIASLVGFGTSIVIGHSFMQNGPWIFGYQSNVDMTTLLNNFVSPGAYVESLIAISILAGIPILLILFIGTKLIFRYKTNNKLIGLGAFGLWLAALILLIIVAVDQVSNFGKQTSQTVTQKVECTQCKTLYLETADDLYESLIDNEISLDRMKIATVNGKDKLLGHPRFTIEKSSSGEYLLLIKKQSRGSSTVDAQKNVEEIEYNFVQKDSTLRFDPYYMLKDEARWRDQEIFLTLKVPEGKSIYLNQKMASIINDIQNTENMWDGDMVGKTWTMTADGLALKKEMVLPVQKGKTKK